MQGAAPNSGADVARLPGMAAYKHVIGFIAKVAEGALEG